MVQNTILYMYIVNGVKHAKIVAIKYPKIDKKLVYQIKMVTIIITLITQI